VSRHRGALNSADDGVLRVLRSSVTDLAARQSDLILLVHQQIIERLPLVTSRLPSNGRGVARRLVRGLIEAALLDDPAAGSAELVRRIGAMNRDEGFGPEHYPATTQMLLHAVRGVYQGEWSSTLSSAWVEYLLWLREHLVAGARGAEPDDESASRDDVSDRDDGSEQDDLSERDDLDDEEPPAYGELMVSMTQATRRDRRDRRRR
jgi:hemoglobin-like flavoprotein